MRRARGSDLEAPALDSARRRAAAAVVLGCLLGLAGCQTPPVASSARADAAPIYSLGPGDRVRVTVFQREDLSGVFEVDSSGRIALPLVRGVQAKGLTVPALEDAIIDRLRREQFSDPKVSVDLVKSRPVCVLGEVNKPGCFDYVYSMRAASAIAMAGGYTYRAKENALLVMRADGERVTGGHAMLVYPGDVVVVSERLF